MSCLARVAPIYPKKLQGIHLVLLALFLLMSQPVCAQICATPGKDGNATGINALGFGGTTVVVNTYFPGTANANAGATSISVGTSRGSATSITAGDLLLVIQIQDATINSSNSDSYGDGVSGGSASGTTSDGGSGNHEYVQATGPVSGGSVPIQGATAGSGLINSYVNAAATSSRGQRRFQVIRVPQYADCEIVGTVESSPWNGTTGGIAAIDVDGTLTFFSGSSVNVTGQGFRAGGGRQLTGDSGGSNTDFRTSATLDFNGAKGEGIAGTPRYLHQSFTGTQPPGQLINTGVQGYPNGSNGRGAPGNAGGGGTDGNTSANDQNSGGGGGGNGGTGGMGGNTWSSNLPRGGHGGSAFSSASVTRLILGGGGGAATRNNSSDVDGSGGAGGGLVMIRAATITGTGTIEANGIEPNAANGLLPANDGGGGGGAGGTLVVFGNAGSLANIDLLANGGDGGDCALTDPTHGPGGGGGGGLIYVNDLLTGTVSVSGGTSGVTSSSAIVYGATDGTAGSAFLNGQITTLEPCGFVPVSLAYFKASPGTKQDVVFDWVTATESGNLGFDIFGYNGREWLRINQKIIPSQTIDSDQPNFYQYKAKAEGFTHFAIEDIDRFGKKTRHDRFALDQAYGSLTNIETIAWSGIAREHQFAEAQRNAGSPVLNPTPRLKVSVREPGMQRLTYQSITSIDQRFHGAAAKDIALLHKGKPVPIRVSSNQTKPGDFFGPGWFVDFLGHTTFDLYSDETVYELTLNSNQALAIREFTPKGGEDSKIVQTYVRTFARQENDHYAFSSPLTDPWYDTQMLAIDALASYEFSLEVTDVLRHKPAQIHIQGYGVTDFPATIDHHLRFYVNDRYLGEWFGNGLEVFDQTFTIPAFVLAASANSLRIELPADLGVGADVIHLESFQLEYHAPIKMASQHLSFTSSGSQFQVTHLPSPDTLVYASTPHGVYYFPKILVRDDKDGNWEALLNHPNQREGEVTFHLSQDRPSGSPEIQSFPADLDILNHRADYLVITHPTFKDSLSPLIQARENQGFKVFVADVNQVYNQFSYGQVNAQAIADYIAHARRFMGVHFVLLVGGDSYDYKNYLGVGSMSFIPTKYVRTGDIVGFAPSDAALGDIDGDGISDVALGRFPVRTAAECQILVEKTLRYQHTQHATDSLFVAGSDENSISFTGFSEHLSTFIPPNWNVENAFVDDLGITQTRAKLVDTINQGLAFLNFFGHSGPTVWTFENLFSAQDAAQLKNDQAPTVVTQWGCWNTYFVAPTYNTMAHKLLLSGSQGAAAVIGASTLTSVSSEQQFAPTFLDNMFKQGTTLGQALIRAKEQTARSYPDLKDIYLGIQLLGDPALMINP